MKNVGIVFLMLMTNCLVFGMQENIFSSRGLRSPSLQPSPQVTRILKRDSSVQSAPFKAQNVSEQVEGSIWQQREQSKQSNGDINLELMNCSLEPVTMPYLWTRNQVVMNNHEHAIQRQMYMARLELQKRHEEEVPRKSEYELAKKEMRRDEEFKNLIIRSQEQRVLIAIETLPSLDKQRLALGHNAILFQDEMNRRQEIALEKEKRSKLTHYSVNQYAHTSEEDSDDLEVSQGYYPVTSSSIKTEEEWQLMQRVNSGEPLIVRDPGNQLLVKDYSMKKQQSTGKWLTKTKKHKISARKSPSKTTQSNNWRSEK